MNFDNRIFNINGRGDEGLALALELAFMQRGDKTTVQSYSVSQQHGLILYWWNDKDEREGRDNLPCSLNSKDIMPMVSAFLNSDSAKTIDCSGWDSNSDHDGSNSLGWRVHCGDWGHLDGVYGHDIIIAIKPAYIWHGK